MNRVNSEIIDREIFLGWAKIKKDENSKGEILNEFHSVIYHLLDAGACAYEILSREPQLIESLRNTFSKDYSQILCQKILSFFAAMHDLGKLSPVFQGLIGAKNKNHISIQQWKSNVNFWTSIENQFLREGKICHGYISSYTLLDYFFSIHKELTNKSYPVRFAIAVGQHHDKSREMHIINYEKWNCVSYYEFSNKSIGESEWQDLRIKVMQYVWNIIVGDELKIEEFILEKSTDSKNIEYQFDIIFAGFVCASDWIASNEKFFKYCSVPCHFKGLKQYFLERRNQAKKVLSGKIYWGNQNSKYFTYSAFYDIFGFQPRAFQKDVLEFVQQANTSSLVILEAPMGMGKTEAALSFLMSPFSNKSRGMYFALPTQATSNQMYERINSILNTFFKDKGVVVQNQLLHGNKKWNDIYLDTLLDSEEVNNSDVSNLNDSCEEIYDGDNELFHSVSEKKSVVSSSWHESSRTGLLAEFAVGTIDQVLRCVLLKEKHYFVKHFALAGKTIILDEIHAYDSYMDQLICNLLSWLSLHNCQVILLSATLPKEKRDKFLNSFLGVNVSTSNSGFPRITMTTKNDKNLFQEKVSSPEDLKSKKTPVQLMEIKDFDDIVNYTLNNLEKNPDGKYKGVVGIVCNTVKTAQAVYQAFYNKGLAHEDIMLFHARFSMPLRLEKEEFIKTKLGKEEFKKLLSGNKSERPYFKIIISTQVIEQSLDIDFDYMYSFLCPIDLLLQRMGRHFRRCRWDLEGNINFKPTLFGVFHEECDEEGLPFFKLCKGSFKVYFEFNLLKTFLVLKDFLHKHEKLDDVFDLEELIYKVYSEEKAFMERKRLQNLKTKVGEVTSEKKHIANDRLLYLPAQFVKLKTERNWFCHVLSDRKPNSSDSPQTRLFDQTRQLLLLILKDKKLYYIDNKNELLEIKNLLSSDRNEIKKIIQTQTTIPEYIYQDIPKNELERFSQDVQYSKYLKNYEGIYLNWNGEYSYNNFEKMEIRYCARLGLYVLNFKLFK